MEKLTSGFVPFQKTQIPFTVVQGVYYVALKPIIEAIGLNYDTAIESIKSNRSLAKHYSLQNMLAADNKMREMACLPHERIYGWLMLVDVNRVSEKAQPVLEMYQDECYRVLFEHFFGRQEAHNRATAVYVELHQKRAYLKGLQKQASETELGQEIAQVKKEIRALQTEQAGLDMEMFGKQLELSPTL